jgi:hypothetical protein
LIAAVDTHELLFDAERHTYTLDGASVAGVTSITELADAPELLEAMTSLGVAEFERRKRLGGEFGTAIHAAAAIIARGGVLLPLSLGERFAASLELVGNWIADNVREALYVEEIMASLRFRVAGKPDLVAMLRGHRRPTIVDYKSGARIYHGARLQQAAYRLIVDEWAGLLCDRLIIHMPAPIDGEAPTLRSIPLRGHALDTAGFLGALQLARSRQELKI